MSTFICLTLTVNSEFAENSDIDIGKLNAIQIDSFFIYSFFVEIIMYNNLCCREHTEM